MIEQFDVVGVRYLSIAAGTCPPSRITTNGIRDGARRVMLVDGGANIMKKFRAHFAFVDDEPVRRVLEDYYLQARSAAKARSHVGAIVGLGSVAEGLLTWALLRRNDDARKHPKAEKRDGEVRDIREWHLRALIEVSTDLGLIGKTAKGAAWALTDFRNFIHPYNLLRQSARPDRALVMSAQAALLEICRSLQGRA